MSLSSSSYCSTRARSARASRHSTKTSPTRLASMFTAQNWARFATSELLRSSTAIDNICHALVSTKKRHSHSAIAQTLRDVSLTVAVFERSLFAYADRIRKHSQSKETSSMRSASVSVQMPSSSQSHKTESPISKFERIDRDSSHSINSKRFVASESDDVFDVSQSDDENLDTFSSASPSPTSMSSSIPISRATKSRSKNYKHWRSVRLAEFGRRHTPWKHSGGVVSLLGLLSFNLDEMRVCMAKLAHLSSFRAFILKRNISFSLLLLPLLIGVLSLREMLQKSYIGLWLSSTTTYFKVCVKKSYVFYGTILCSFIASLYTLYYRLQLAQHQRLQRLHKKLSIIFRLWNICMSVIDYDMTLQINARFKQNKPISRWLLELVPPSLDSSWWYSSSHRLALLSHALNVLYASINVWYSWAGMRWYGLPLALSSALVYAAQPHLAAVTSTELLASPDILTAKKAWSTYDNAATQYFLWSHIFIAPNLAVVRDIEFDAPNGRQLRLTILRARKKRLGIARNPLVLNIRCGGWMANVLASDIRYLGEWALSTDATVVSIDFALERNHTYSEAVLEASALYTWILSGGHGFVPSSIILVGDSIGGNLAIHICIQAILNQQRRPDLLVLAYPALNLHLEPTPSKCIFMMDPIVPANLLYHCRSTFFPNSEKNPELCDSLLTTSNRLLRCFPPTSLLVGSLDPFLDDSVEFAHMLSAQGIHCQFKLYDYLPHAFLGFSMILPQVRVAIDIAGQWIKAKCY